MSENEEFTQEEGMEGNRRRQDWLDKYGHKLRRGWINPRHPKDVRMFRILSEFPLPIFIVVTLFILLIIVWSKKYFLMGLQYWFIIFGTIQIFAGVYLGLIRIAFLKKIAIQEAIRETKFVRPVGLDRYLLKIISKVEHFNNNKGLYSGMDLCGYLKKWAEDEEKEHRTVGGKLYLIKQEDLAALFNAASSNAAYGTVMVVMGTLISLIRDFLG